MFWRLAHQSRFSRDECTGPAGFQQLLAIKSAKELNQLRD